MDYKPNPDGSGWLIRFDDGTSLIVSTEKEAVTMATKIGWAQRAQTMSNNLAVVLNSAADLESSYFDRGYNAGPTAITDSDVESLGITAANVSSFITMSQQLAKFVGNEVVTQGDYDSTINAMRTDV